MQAAWLRRDTGVAHAHTSVFDPRVHLRMHRCAPLSSEEHFSRVGEANAKDSERRDDGMMEHCVFAG